MWFTYEKDQEKNVKYIYLNCFIYIKIFGYAYTRQHTIREYGSQQG